MVRLMFLLLSRASHLTVLIYGALSEYASRLLTGFMVNPSALKSVLRSLAHVKMMLFLSVGSFLVVTANSAISFPFAFSWSVSPVVLRSSGIRCTLR